MLALACLVTLCRLPRGDDLHGDGRLGKRISLHEEIIALDDLASGVGKQVGVALYVKHRVADRKVTIVFKDRPAEEVMERLADCMLMSWRKAGSGYELDLTPKAAAAEARTEAAERERTRAGLRDAVREIRRLWALSPQGRVAETLRLDEEFRRGLKSGDAASPHMQSLGREISAIHSAGFVEVVGAALSSAKLDEEGVPVGTTWFCSANPDDPAGHIDLNGIPVNPRSRDGAFTDAIGVVSYKEEDHEIQSSLFAASAKDGGTVHTSAGGWPIEMSDPSSPSEMDRLMNEWSRPISSDLAKKPLENPKAEAASSEYRSGMFGRAQLLVDFADRSGIPVVADAFRRALTTPMWLAGTTVQQSLDSYAKVCKTPYQGRADYAREESGWLIFRADHWWWNLKPEIPESVLRPLEQQAIGHSPLPLTDYLRFLTGLNVAQVASLRRPEFLLLRFPVGSLGSSAYSVTLFSLLDSAGRAQALSNEGMDLDAAGPEAQALAYDAVLTLAAAGRAGDLQSIRAVLRGGKGILKGLRFFAEDEIGKATSAADIGNGRDIKLSFSYSPTHRYSPYSETFSCSKAGT